jgi:hypothetical protein
MWSPVAESSCKISWKCICYLKIIAGEDTRMYMFACDTQKYGNEYAVCGKFSKNTDALNAF